MPPDRRSAISAERSPWLRGSLRVPGDIVVSHLAVLAGAIARGETVIAGGLASVGTEAVERAVAALGARCERTESGVLRVLGLGLGGLLEPAASLDFSGAALGLRLVMGLVAGYDFGVRFTADPEVAAQPRAALLDGLRALGCTVDSGERGRLPLTLRGPDHVLHAELALPAGEPATKAALILAALNAREASIVVESEPGWNHAERLLRRFGARIEAEDVETGRRIVVHGRPELRAQPVDVPADPSLAALGAAAAAIVSGSEVSIGNVLVNPARTAVLSALMAMGVSIELHELRFEGEEEVADLVVRSGPLRAVAFAAHHVAPLLADLPLLAVVAAFAEGETTFLLPAGLPLLEHARLATLSQALAANGIRHSVAEEAVVVAGRRSAPGGARLDLDDPGIALAMLVLGMGADRQVTLTDRSVIKERFPGFVEAFEEIGASFVTEGAGG
jgi:3-phosphoshikimate 1-carboxyvinyltransferase